MSLIDISMLRDNRSLQMSQALQMQIEVQKRLHEQLEARPDISLSWMYF